MVNAVLFEESDETRGKRPSRKKLKEICYAAIGTKKILQPNQVSHLLGNFKQECIQNKLSKLDSYLKNKQWEEVVCFLINDFPKDENIHPYIKKIINQNRSKIVEATIFLLKNIEDVKEKEKIRMDILTGKNKIGEILNQKRYGFFPSFHQYNNSTVTKSIEKIMRGTDKMPLSQAKK